MESSEMTQTIVGVFDTFQEANNAVENLVQAGFARSSIDVHAQSTDTGLTASSDSAALGSRPSDRQDEGVMARIEQFFENLFGGDDRPQEVMHYQEAVRRGGALLTVDVVGDTQVDTVRAVLEGAGAVDIDERVTQWQSTGYTGYQGASLDTGMRPYSTEDTLAGGAASRDALGTTTSPDAMDATASTAFAASRASDDLAEEKALPVVREELQVGKREVQTGAFRVYTRATETPVSETVTLREEHASIDRHAVDRPATAADMREGVVEVRETAERPVVEKTARVVEEVVVSKQATERSETVNETLRGTEVEVERLPQDGVSGTTAAPGTDTKKPL
jgi:uncharacterized protein (TIGR02271 family)